MPTLPENASPRAHAAVTAAFEQQTVIQDRVAAIRALETGPGSADAMNELMADLGGLVNLVSDAVQAVEVGGGGDGDADSCQVADTTEGDGTGEGDGTSEGDEAAVLDESSGDGTTEGDVSCESDGTGEGDGTGEAAVLDEGSGDGATEGDGTGDGV